MAVAAARDLDLIPAAMTEPWPPGVAELDEVWSSGMSSSSAPLNVISKMLGIPTRIIQMRWQRMVYIVRPHHQLLYCSWWTESKISSNVLAFVGYEKWGKHKRSEVRLPSAVEANVADGLE